MMRLTTAAQLAASLLLGQVHLTAYAVYKCTTSDAGIVYSDIPCNPSAEKLQQQPALQSETAATKNQSAREKTELHRLQNLRELRERQETQIHQMQQRSLEAKRKRCQALALDKKWKQEDASNVNLTLKQQEQAQKKLRRSIEKYQSHCE